MLTQCANALATNPSYLSKAINEERGVNFNVFINSYRITTAKELIRTSSHRYTLQHIYLSSGFKSQPVFNKAFKDAEGVTPSEYSEKTKV